MRMKIALEKLPDKLKPYFIREINRALTMCVPGPNIPTLDEAFALLGRAIIRGEILRDLLKKVSEHIGYHSVTVKIDEIDALIKNGDEQTIVIRKMIRALSIKEMQDADNNKSLDVQVGQQPEENLRDPSAQ